LLCASAASYAQEQEAETYVYSTYFYCDVAGQERADELTEAHDKPVYDAAVADGTMTGWGWLAHHTGGKWRRVQYHTAPSMEALLAGQQKIGQQLDANEEANAEFGSICKAHDDYIWRVVAGSDGKRGTAGFSVYYVCDSSREMQADELMKRVFAERFDKLVADGKLASWGWLEHIVGGEYRRLATMTAADVPALMAARGQVIEELINDPLFALFDDICGSHADYIWESQHENP
jgi:hypothetical protein